MCARQTPLERQDLSCTYLAHHELESVIIVIIRVVWTQWTQWSEHSGVEAFDSLLDKCMPNGRDDVAFEWDQTRLGAYCSDQERPRPIHVQFRSNDKHAVLKHAKHLKQVSVRYDDDLTRLQQKQRQDMATDFDTLKSKGHKPFYRGSLLRTRHADKTRTCKRHGATGAPDAQVQC